MALTVPLVGEVLLLQYILGLGSVNPSFSQNASAGPVLHLFSNNITPGNSTVLSNLVECTSSGYAPITLVSTSWTTSTTSPSGIATGLYSQATFVFNTNAISYGYWVSDTLNNLLFLEVYSSGPFSISSSGGSISITSRVSLS